MAREIVGAQAGRLIATLCYKRPPRHERTSRVLEVGASGMGAKAVDRKSIFLELSNQAHAVSS